MEERGRAPRSLEKQPPRGVTGIAACSDSQPEELSSRARTRWRRFTSSYVRCLPARFQFKSSARDAAPRGGMASSFGARRSENVDALFTQAVESFVGVDAGEENLSIAHNYCLYHAKHHSFPDTDPRKVRGALDALRERLGIHAQLDKQRALDMLVGRFDRRPWPADVPDVHARVLQLLLGLSRNPPVQVHAHRRRGRCRGGRRRRRDEGPPRGARRRPRGSSRRAAARARAAPRRVRRRLRRRRLRRALGPGLGLGSRRVARRPLRLHPQRLDR